MSRQSWFDPDRVYKHLDEYLPLTQTPYAELCETLQARFDEEVASPEGQARQAKLANRLREHLARFDDDGLPDRIAARFHQVFYLEQMLLGLSLSQPNFFGDVIRVHGLEEAKAAAAETGAIFVLPHMGPHFIAHLAINRCGLHAFGAGAISGPMANGLLRTAALHGIDMGNTREVDFDQDFKSNLMGLLAAGKSITLYPEYSRSPRLGALTVPFMGHDVHAPTGIARLASGFAKPMIGVHLHRRAPYHYDLVFGDVWQPAPHGDSEGVHQSMRDIFGWLEHVVKADPLSWEGWRYFGIMKDNGMKVVLKNFVEAKNGAAAQAEPRA